MIFCVQLRGEIKMTCAVVGQEHNDPFWYLLSIALLMLKFIIKQLI